MVDVEIALPGDGGPHCFVSDLDSPVLDPGDHHHLERVLRLRPGDQLTVGDGVGGWAPCRFGPSLEVVGPVGRVAPPSPRLTVGFALVKGERPELVIQKLTEAGIDRIVPFTAERSVVRWDHLKAAKQHGRFVRIAREAAMQSRRLWLPEIVALATFAQVSASTDPVVVRADVAGRSLRRTDRFVLVGPEGGWSPAERDASADAVTLGPTVMRAETAAIAAGVLLVALRGGYVGETSQDAGPPAQYH
ncbi:MAG: 16S rRNA (uracil(1498)-N(3))-methyltransferase [Acidimicrobiales bacterium]|nr:16S rRNA (uracil(1498)-N(3))-methyltransferase [Acidimicrobiales bacterium]